MGTYASVEDIQKRLGRTLSATEINLCEALLEDAGIIIDASASKANESAKKIASCRMVIRALGDGAEIGVPIGATQGSMSALGYSQSWTMSSGGVGELYLSKTEKHLLGIGNSIGSASPLSSLICKEGST